MVCSWKSGVTAAGALAAAIAVPQAAWATQGKAAPPDYSDTSIWLCRPDNTPGFCQADLDATAVLADGTLQRESWAGADSQAPIDCFFLYPTASLDPASNSDLVPGDQPGEEIHDIQREFARFGEACRLYAPMYRSTTITQMIGQAPPGDRELAYSDVLAAWRYYLAHDNHGRGVVLIGHSQGAGMIRRLMMEEIEGKPAQKLLVSALPIGANVAVPAGKDVGGDFKTIPLCRSKGQIGCVLTYNSYRADSPPTPESFLGNRRDDGLHNACVNPAALGGGSAPLDAYLETRYTLSPDKSVPQAPWTDPAQPIDTPFVRVPGLISAECRSDGQGDYLAITIHADPADPRVDDIQGDVRRGGKRLAEWGLHVIDMELAMGDLVRVVKAQAAAWAASH